MSVVISNYYQFASSLKTIISTSSVVSLLAKNTYLKKKMGCFIFTFVFKSEFLEGFADYKILSWQFYFFFQHFECVLPLSSDRYVSYKKSAVLISVPCMWQVSFACCFQNFSLWPWLSKFYCACIGSLNGALHFSEDMFIFSYCVFLSVFSQCIFKFDDIFFPSAS